MASTVSLVVGLGNPGSAYGGTPHNAGFAVVEQLAKASGCRLRKSRLCDARVGRMQLDGAADVRLMQPQTYMNSSGDAVAVWLRYYRCPPGQVLVITDDIDLPLGTLRLRGGGSSGGHKGLRSIIEQLATDRFPRLRVGVGRGNKDNDMVSHVLTPFSKRENECFTQMVDLAADAVRCLLSEGLDAAMNRFNGRRAEICGGDERENRAAERGEEQGR